MTNVCTTRNGYNESMAHLTATQVIEELDISHRDLRKLVACNVLRGERVGAVTIYDADRVREIASRKKIQPSVPPAAIAVRMSTPESTDDPLWPTRKYTGWNDEWPDPFKVDAVRGWWRIAPPFRVPGTPLVVLVGPVVVAVYEVLDDDTPKNTPGGLCRLRIGPATPEQTKHYGDKLVRLGPGPISMPI